MSLEYSGISVDIFVNKLCDEMSKRVDEFEKHMLLYFTQHPEKTKIKSKKQWLLEYKKWIVKNSIEKDILKYLSEE